MGLRWRLCAGTKCQILTTSVFLLGGVRHGDRTRGSEPAHLRGMDLKGLGGHAARPAPGKTMPVFGNSFPFSFRGMFLWAWGVLAPFHASWPLLNLRVAPFDLELAPDSATLFHIIGSGPAQRGEDLPGVGG
jgi:hypothetical protein